MALPGNVVSRGTSGSQGHPCARVDYEAWRMQFPSSICWARAPSLRTRSMPRAAQHGFFYVVGHGIEEALGQRLEVLSRQFFRIARDDQGTLRDASRRSCMAWLVSARRRIDVGQSGLEGRPVHRNRLARFAPARSRGLPLHGRNLVPGDDLAARIRDDDWRMDDGGHGSGPARARSDRVVARFAADVVSRRMDSDPLVLFRIFLYPTDPCRQASMRRSASASTRTTVC